MQAIGYYLWEKKGCRGFVTDKQVAKYANISEGTVQKYFGGQEFSFRRPAKSSGREVLRAARNLNYRVTNIQRNQVVRNLDYVSLVCMRCGMEKSIQWNTLKHDAPRCQCCNTRGRHNPTQHLIIALMGRLLNVVLEEDITPDFLRRATRREYRYDGFNLESRYIVEYQGEQHSRPVMLPGIKSWTDACEKHRVTKENDKIKRACAEAHGYTYIIVDTVASTKIKDVIKPVQAAFRRTQLTVPTEHEIAKAYKGISVSSGYGISACRRHNAISRITNKKSRVMDECRRLGITKSTVYRWLREYRQQVTVAAELVR